MSDPSTGSASGTSQTRQAVMYCPYCAEETLFPIEAGGWECRSCLRAFSVKFIGLVQTPNRSRPSMVNEQGASS